MKLIYNESYTNSQSDLLKVKELVGYMMSFDMGDEKLLDEQKKEIQNYLSAMKDKIKALADTLLEQEKLDRLLFCLKARIWTLCGVRIR